MPPSNAMENDKKRLRNQFTKDERTRLLAIMTEYGPLLDDKNISILSRKEIWEIIENKFNENGHSGRTSAQLKKYWQNYKYHSKRAKIIQKEVPKTLSPMTKQMVRMLAKVNPEEWSQYEVKTSGEGVPKKSPESSKSSPAAQVNCAPSFSFDFGSSKSTNAGASSCEVIRRDSKNEKSESNVVVSTTDVPGSSVTVSVFCPEVQPKGRSIFLKRSTPPEKVTANFQPNYVDENDRTGNEGRNSPGYFRREFENFDVCHAANNEAKTYPRVGELVRQNNGMFASNKTGHGERRQVPKTLSQSMFLSRQGLGKNRSPVNITEATTSRENQSNFIGNVPRVVKEIPKATTGSPFKGSDSVEKFRSLSTRKEENDATNESTLEGIQKQFRKDSITPRDNRVVKEFFDGIVEPDCSELNEMLQQFPTAGSCDDAIKETIERFRLTGKGNIQVNSQETLIPVTDDKGERAATNRKDFSWLKLYLRLLQSATPQLGVTRHLDEIRKLAPFITASSLAKNNSVANIESYRTQRDEGMELEQEKNPENEGGGLKVRRISSMGPPNDGGDQIRREIKVEREEEQETMDLAENPVNADVGNDRAINSANYLIRARLQCVKSELDHRLKLQKLEMAEKELKVRIAEMTVQENKLRIQALIEERLRTKELHELRLAHMAAEKVRSEAEHTARLDASCVATAESRARINSVERDRERSENFYQIQLRYMNGSGMNGNGVNNGNCKQCL